MNWLDIYCFYSIQVSLSKDEGGKGEIAAGPICEHWHS